MTAHQRKGEPLDLVAMHGWGGDGRAWNPWAQAAALRGWTFSAGERGYGRQPPRTLQWQGSGPRGLLVHSLGLHLVPPTVLAEAEAVVLLASFGRFVPEGAEGRRERLALEGMAQRLDRGDVHGLLRDFLAEAAAPDPVDLLPAGPLEDGVPAAGGHRLLEDLGQLGCCTGLPSAFPREAAVLVVEAGADRIVAPESRRLLREALPNATQWTLEGAGHSLLRAQLLEPVLDWLRQVLGGDGPRG
jgi:pimeloyl-[acyl-carrier protein] methyl ester esterase